MSDQIYIAGALFTPAQRARLEEIESVCRSVGLETYLPHRDAGLFDRDDSTPEAVFKQDMEAVDDSDYLLTVLNGPPFDSGTAWELGYAHARGIPAVGFVEDERVFDVDRQLNPMLVGSVRCVASSLDELEASLKELIE